MIACAKVKSGKKLVAAALSLLAMSAAHAYTVDERIGYTTLANSSDDAELTYVESVAQQELTLSSRIDSPADALASLVVGTDQYLIDLDGFSALPGYFLLKFGSGNTSSISSATTFVFKNIDEMDKLVFTSGQVFNLIGNCGNDTCNIGRLSHYTLFTGSEGGNGGNGGEVPEPATAALLGLGLLGVAASRRKARARVSKT